MNFKSLLGLILFCVGTFGASAQQVTLSPLPQSIVWGAKAFDNPVTFVINGAATADQDAVALLKAKLSTGQTGIELIIGEKGDAAVQAVEAEIPTQKEGYYLKVEPGKVTIAGTDSAGTYYGVQSFLQVASSLQTMSVTIKDYPNVVDRGLVEGYYGNPYSHADRLKMFEFFGQNKMNVYIYGPKDDPYHKAQWRVPYPAAEAAKMVQLVTTARKNNVQFVWAIHPGSDIQWTKADSVALKTKFEAMYNLGVRAFSVFFDDIGGIGTDPTRQANLMNYLDDEFVQKKSDVAPLILCPTQYNRGWASGTYLSILGTVMHKNVRIMWTGNSVVDMINKTDMDWINGQISRNAYIWLNYPVTDYCIDHLLMGPTYGNDLNIATQLSGFTSNPMEYAEASKVSLYSIADYTWNMPAYDAQASWLRGLTALMPQNAASFKVFCENNVDLGSTYHGLRRVNESAPFKIVGDAFMTAYNKGTYSTEQADLLAAQFQSFRDASANLMASTTNAPLIVEIKPWLQSFDMIGNKGLSLVKMYKALHNNDSITFIKEYQRIDSLETLQKAIVSRPGTIKATTPKPANEVVTPYIKQLKAMLVNEYKRKFKYMVNVFPKQILEEGRYFIKYNGSYLTNKTTTTGNPIYVATRDNINPQRQEWLITIDPLTERYKLVNAQDLRYLNELGNFGSNTYDAAWNSYSIYRLNNRYAIQNAGSAGDKFWISNATRLSAGTVNIIKVGNFILEIIPVGDDTIQYPVILPAETYYIKSGSTYLTNNNVSGTGSFPIFKSLTATQSKSQQWTLTVDATTDRYKLASAADSRYVNENGTFGTNAYFATWNSYVLTEMDSKFAIQNAGDAGTKFWNNSTNRMATGDAIRQDSYVFELIPTTTIYPTAVEKVEMPKKHSLKVTDNVLYVNGGSIKSLKLISLNGITVRQNVGKDYLLLRNLSAGIYILMVTSPDSKEESFKVII